MFIEFISGMAINYSSWRGWEKRAEQQLSISRTDSDDYLLSLSRTAIESCLSICTEFCTRRMKRLKKEASSLILKNVKVLNIYK